jgi:hypothetical protein
MNINNRLLKAGFKRSQNLIWDVSAQKYVDDSKWIWTYTYKMDPIEVRAVINKRSISIFTIDYSKKSKWGNNPMEKCIFNRVCINSATSFSEIIKSLPKDLQRDIKIKSIL